jgi:GNAT superfamily N-acetyltransferase
MKIRYFQYADLEAVIQLAKLSFAKEFTAQGLSLDSFTQQVKLATRGRMIPFKLLTSLTGIKWHFFVAEIQEKIVGFGGYTGRKQIELNNLMVHPDFRRQGIGQALLQARLKHLAHLGFSQVTTNILEGNYASLGNIKKQGFEIFDKFTIFEKTLPLPPQSAVTISSRPLQPTDHSTITNIEKQLSSERYLDLSGSMLPNYAPSPGNRALSQLTGGRKYVRVFENHSEIIGILAVYTSGGHTKGTVFRPLVLDEYLDKLPAMLYTMGSWLTKLEKSTIRVTVAHNREDLLQQISYLGWQPTHTWVRAFKKLSTISR